MRDALDLVNELGVLASQSGKFQVLFKSVAAGHYEIVKALKPLCATRWTVRGKAVRNTIDQYEAIVEALEEMAAGSSNVATRAGGLLVRFQKGITLLALYMALTVIEPLEILNTGLQARENTVAGMMKTVDVSEEFVGKIAERGRFRNSFQENGR